MYTDKRMKFDSYITLYRKLNSKWIRDLSRSPKILKLLGGNIGKTFHDIGFGKYFLDRISKVYTKKPKNN